MKAHKTADDGNGTVLMLAIISMGLTLTVAIAEVGRAMIARHQAAQAADLGALAGAASASCPMAEQTVRHNGGQTASCLIYSDGTVQVVATVTIPGKVLMPTATATARAGWP